MRRIEIKTPEQFKPGEQAAFETLVLKSGEVTFVGLSRRVASSHRLVLGYEGDELLGVGALKDPMGHRDTVARDSHAPMTKEAYPFELGWLFVEAKARRTGLATDMIAELLDGVTAGVYATSHITNAGMHFILEQHGFARAGIDYPSTMRPGVQIRLFQRPGD